VGDDGGAVREGGDREREVVGVGGRRKEEERKCGAGYGLEEDVERRIGETDEEAKVWREQGRVWD